MPAAQAREVIERELGAPLEALFEWIDLEEPLGSASIGQVLPSDWLLSSACCWHRWSGVTHVQPSPAFSCLLCS